MSKYVWLNLNTGEFSNSWGEQVHSQDTSYFNNVDKESHWKLIKYDCLTDSEFELYDRMKIVTNLRDKN